MLEAMKLKADDPAACYFAVDLADADLDAEGLRMLAEQERRRREKLADAVQELLESLPAVVSYYDPIIYPELVTLPGGARHKMVKQFDDGKVVSFDPVEKPSAPAPVPSRDDGRWNFTCECGIKWVAFMNPFTCRCGRARSKPAPAGEFRRWKCSNRKCEFHEVYPHAFFPSHVFNGDRQAVLRETAVCRCGGIVTVIACDESGREIVGAA